MAHLLLRLDTNASARLRRLIPFVLQPEGVVTLELTFRIGSAIDVALAYGIGLFLVAAAGDGAFL